MLLPFICLLRDCRDSSLRPGRSAPDPEYAKARGRSQMRRFDLPAAPGQHGGVIPVIFAASIMAFRRRPSVS